MVLSHIIEETGGSGSGDIDDGEVEKKERKSGRRKGEHKSSVRKSSRKKDRSPSKFVLGLCEYCCYIRGWRMIRVMGSLFVILTYLYRG